METARSNARRPLVLLLLLLAATFISKRVALGEVVGDWIPTGSLNVPRDGHTATVLADGKVLVVGGANGVTELYDPATGTWSLTASLNTPRVLHTATLLPNGKVLVAGGITNSTLTNSAELYDPATGTWSVTGSLNIARFWYTATLLANGKVLVVAGAGGETSAELYDPATGTWNITGSLNTARYGQTATLLQDGKVLIAGGSNDGDLASTLDSAESYDPATGTWSGTGNLNASRILHSATLLPNGKVLVAGGYFPNMVLVDTGFYAASPTSLNGAEIYDPVSGTWSITGSLNTARDLHTATLLPDGQVLVAAGEKWTASNPPCGLTASCLLYHSHLDKAELYDFVTGTWRVTAALNTARSRHSATLLLDGVVLVAGGQNDSGTLNSTELYDDSVPGTLPLMIGASVLPDAEVGVAYSVPLVNGGRPPYTVNLVRGVLPPGLSDTLASGTLSGTPASTTKSRSFIAQITDDRGSSITGTFTLKILRALENATRTLKSGTNGRPYRATLKAAGGKKPYSWSLVSGNLPAGLSLDGLTGVIAGTPTETGTFDLTFHVTDVVGGIVETAQTLTIK